MKVDKSWVGEKVGLEDGLKEGEIVGKKVGMYVGKEVGLKEGELVGKKVGLYVGK